MQYRRNSFVIYTSEMWHVSLMQVGLVGRTIYLLAFAFPVKGKGVD